MHTIKKILLVVSLVMVAMLGWVAGSVASSDTIIDSEFVNSGVLAEPLFGNPIPETHGAQRGLASVDTSSEKPKDKATAKYNKSPDQYVDVQQAIPSSAPSLTKAGLERAILNNGD